MTTKELSDESLHTFLDMRLLWGRKPAGIPFSMPLVTQDNEGEQLSDWKRYLNIHYAQETWKKVTERRQKPKTEEKGKESVDIDLIFLRIQKAGTDSQQ
ncbi:16672_t:CDS:2 [Acaulospora colombiana]|uniref:16672_t:CDS:1 n=1 Tax=Acaulospora colombiana TaxID=27376 RepID=A0ACA9NSN3_9GLOM|nr:16672_t:CDS:2 [Acaulospora colombiana]